MKLKLLAPIFLLVSIFFTIPVLGVKLTPEMAKLENGKAAWQLMELNGFDKEIAILRPVFARVASKLRDNQLIPYGRRMAASRVIEGMFDTDGLTLEVHRILAGQWHPAKMAVVEKFLRSPLGRRFAEMEGRPEDFGRGRWMENWEQNRPSDKRIGLVLLLDRAAGISKVAVEMWTLVTLITILSSNDPNVSISGTEAQNLGRMRDMVRHKIGASVQKSVVLGLLYTYRRASDAELEAYANFYRSEAGSWYARTMEKAWLNALIHRAIQVRHQARARVAL